MSSVLVKRQLLVAVTALNIPLDKIPNKEKVDGICSASKIVRNRLLREHARVTETIEILRQNQQDDVLADIDEEPEYDDDEFVAVASDNSTARSEFLYVAELKTAEKLVIPLLLAYGMRFSDTLLPQLLKLLIALLQPIPRFSEGELVQRDALSHIKIRCGSDEFFAFLVQCAAPITEKRSAGKANKADIAMLELILTTISLLLDNPAPETENTIGAFCRNHGVELLLVMVNQNFSSREKNKAILEGNFDINEDGDAENSQIDQNTESQVESLNLINLQEEGSDDDGLIIEDGGISRAEQGFQYDSTMQIAESDAQILKWNTLILHTISHIFKGVDLNELSLIGFQTQNADGQNTKSLFSIPNNDKYMKDCKRETDNWRYIAKSKQGAFNSNGLIVRSDSNKPLQTVGSKTMGTISSIFGTKRKDPLDIMKDMDKRKKGRFVKGMYEDSTTRSNLPFPTKIILSQQTFSFLCFGFEPLSSMVAEQMMGVGNKIMMATKEHKDAVSGFKGSGEAIEITSPIDTSLYSELTEVIHYMMTCSSFLHYIRKSIFLMKEKDLSFDMPSFQQQWQSVSSIVTLEHLEMGFTVLRSFLQIRDLRRRLDIKCVTNFLSEILLLLNLLLGGEIIKDPSVEVAAHALASSILYKEENIKATFDLLKEYAQRNLAMEKAQAFSLFTYAVFQLMEKCSYKGTLLLPKKQPRKGRHEEAQDGIEDDDSDNSSITSETNRAMLESMADMIDDSEEVRNSRGDEEAEEVAEQETNDVGEVQTPQMGFIGNDVDDPSAVFSPLPKNTEDAEEGQSRDASVAPPRSETSLSSSGQTVFSTISSEREVSLDSYVSRLVTPKNSTLLYATLRHWRLNDADVNLALTFLFNRIVSAGCGSIFYNISFFLVIRDILVYGKETHRPLYEVCDEIIFNFFNPSNAVARELREMPSLNENEKTVLSGSQSHVGFEVALRCARALFQFSVSDYAVLEDKSYLTHRTAIDIPETTAAGDQTENLPPQPERSRRKRRRDNDPDGDEEGKKRKKRSRRKESKTETNDPEEQTDEPLDRDTIDAIVEKAEKLDRKAEKKKKKHKHKKDKKDKKDKEKRREKRRRKKEKKLEKKRLKALEAAANGEGHIEHLAHSQLSDAVSA